MNLTTQPGARITVVATSALVKNRFVTVAGATCGNHVRALGVVDDDFDSGATVGVIYDGIVLIELGATLSAGAEVTSDANGKAIAVSTYPNNGLLLDGGVSGDIVRLMLP